MLECTWKILRACLMNVTHFSLRGSLKFLIFKNINELPISSISASKDDWRPIWNDHYLRHTNVSLTTGLEPAPFGYHQWSLEVRRASIASRENIFQHNKIIQYNLTFTVRISEPKFGIVLRLGIWHLWCYLSIRTPRMHTCNSNGIKLCYVFMRFEKNIVLARSRFIFNFS